MQGRVNEDFLLLDTLQCRPDPRAGVKGRAAPVIGQDLRIVREECEHESDAVDLKVIQGRDPPLPSRRRQFYNAQVVVNDPRALLGNDLPHRDLYERAEECPFRDGKGPNVVARDVPAECLPRALDPYFGFMQDGNAKGVTNLTREGGLPARGWPRDEDILGRGKTWWFFSQIPHSLGASIFRVAR